MQSSETTCPVSLSVFTARWYSPHQLAFLLLSLTHVCLQLYRVAEKGVCNYWRKPGNWLEVASCVFP